MRKMTMRERMLAVIQGREHDRVPFAMYEIMLPAEQAFAVLGHGNLGLIRFCSIYRAENPHCRFESNFYYEGETKWQRNIWHTPKGDLEERRIFEPEYDSSTARKHFVETREDYERLWSYLEDAVILDNYDQYYRDCAELGDDGIPKPEIERTPWQQLWIEWVGLEALSYHLVEWPDHVNHTLDLLEKRARQTFEIAARSPAPYIVIVDNITAPAIGPARFRKYCTRLYDELAGRLEERKAPVFVHMMACSNPCGKTSPRAAWAAWIHLRRSPIVIRASTRRWRCGRKNASGSTFRERCTWRRPPKSGRRPIKSWRRPGTRAGCKSKSQRMSP